MDQERVVFQMGATARFRRRAEDPCPTGTGLTHCSGGGARDTQSLGRVDTPWTSAQVADEKIAGHTQPIGVAEPNRTSREPATRE